jgi:hypothetical protein
VADARTEDGIEAVMKATIAGACVISETNKQRNTLRFANDDFEMSVPNLLSLPHKPSKQE